MQCSHRYFLSPLFSLTKYVNPTLAIDGQTTPISGCRCTNYYKSLTWTVEPVAREANGRSDIEGSTGAPNFTVSPTINISNSRSIDIKF